MTAMKDYGKAKDFSLRRTRNGRFEGDLFVTLDYIPGLKRPFRATVWEWHTGCNWDQVEDWGPQWYASRKGLSGEFDHIKHFKRAWDAAIYVGKVRGFADAFAITERMEQAREAGKTVLA